MLIIKIVFLFRTNQLRAIDEKEATSKVNAARLKARERSKVICHKLYINI